MMQAAHTAHNVAPSPSGTIWYYRKRDDDRNQKGNHSGRIAFYFTFTFSSGWMMLTSKINSIKLMHIHVQSAMCESKLTDKVIMNLSGYCKPRE